MSRVTLLLGSRVILRGEVMAIGGWGEVLRGIRGLLHGGVTAGLSDEQLLTQFAAGAGESSELAFAALVERHGGMVLRVCRGVLGDEQEAQDAFQATFLILARKAGSLWVHGTLGPWLYGVAPDCRRGPLGRCEAETAREEGRRDGATRQQRWGLG